MDVEPRPTTRADAEAHAASEDDQGIPPGLARPLDPGANARRQALRVAHRQTPVGPLQPHDPAWAGQFEAVRESVVGALGDRVLAVEHVGSTAVPDLLAKPVIDIDLTVADVEDEAAWLPALEGVGFRLIFRDEMGGDRHRQLTLADPNTNLHVWSPGASEPRRHVLFRDWLRAHPDDRRRYETAKLAASAPDRAGTYNDAKSEVVHAIYARALAGRNGR